MSDEVHDISDAEQVLVEAAALVDERDQLRAEVERLRAELRRWSSAMSDRGETLFAAQAERDRLRAVLAETAENVAAVAHHVGVVRSIGSHLSNEEVAAGILADQRARAGMEPTPAAAKQPDEPARLTLDEARGAIGRRVRYTPLGRDPEGEGTITSVNDAYVFVRFGLAEVGEGIACTPADLVLLP